MLDKIGRLGCNIIKTLFLHLLHLHVVSPVTGSKDDLLLSIPQMLLYEVGSLHRPLQQVLVPQHSSNTSIG